LGSDEGRVTIESKNPTDAIDREQQMLTIFEIERPANDRFGTRHIAEGLAAGGRDSSRDREEIEAALAQRVPPMTQEQRGGV
jgi:hypothetical protein